MESPVRIKIGIAVLVTLLLSAEVCNGYPQDNIKEKSSNILIEHSSESPAAQSEKENTTAVQYPTRNVTERYQRKDYAASITTNKIDVNVTDVKNSTTNIPSTTTNRIVFRGTTKFYTTKPPFKPKIPHMRRNFTRNVNNKDKNNTNDSSTEATIIDNEILAIQKLKEAKLNETLEKLREIKMVTQQQPKIVQNIISTTDKTSNQVDSVGENLKSSNRSEGIKSLETDLIPSNRSEGIKSLETDFNIDKYISEDFHDINNVYSQHVSPDVEHYIIPENVSDYYVSVGSKPYVKSTSSDYLMARTTHLTTPRSDYFDKRFKEVSESIQQNLADVDMDYANDENTTPDEEDSEVNFDDILSQPLSNNSNLLYKNTREIILSNLKNKNNQKSYSDGTNETQIVYEVSTIATNVYEHVVIKTTTPEADNVKQNEITTVPSRNQKSSSSERREHKTEPSIERRSDHFRTNNTRKEYLTTIRMRARTTPKPRIRISLKNNRNPLNTTQEIPSSKENTSTSKTAEVVKMHPYTKNRNTLSTTSSQIDPVAITASDAVESFVSSLSKRGSTKFTENFNETTNNIVNDTTSSFSIPPTATAWALIKFKDVPFVRKSSSSNNSDVNMTALDNSIKSENEEINTVNSTLAEPVIEPELETSTYKKALPTMEAGESNVESVTSSMILPTVTTQKTTTKLEILKDPQTNSINSVEIETKSSIFESGTKEQSMGTTVSHTTEKASTKYITKSIIPTRGSNEIPKVDNNLTTQVITEDNNTTSTVGTESNTESLSDIENFSDEITTTDNEVISSFTPGNNVYKGEENIFTTEDETLSTTTSDTDYTSTVSNSILTREEAAPTTGKVELEGETESIQSTKSFIDEFSTTVKPEEEDKTEDKMTTENIENIKITTSQEEDDLDDFSFSSMSSKTDSTVEASGDVEESTLLGVSGKTDNPTTIHYVTSTLVDHMTQPTTINSKYVTTVMSQKPTTKSRTTITTSLLPFSEDVSDSREGKNKIISEEEDKGNSDDDWIDSEASPDAKNIDSNEIPVQNNNKTESDIAETEDNNTDNEIPKIGRNDSVVTSTSTMESNIEVILPNHSEFIPESEERESRETTTIYIDDIGDFDPVDGSGTIAAIAISTIGIVALLLLVGILLVARGRRQGGGYGQRCTPVSLDSYSLDNVSVSGSTRRKGRRASKRSYGNPAYDEAGATSHPMQFAALANFALDQQSIINEFNEIPMIHARADEVPPGCESKNRFSNVIPLPETRVFLKLLPGDETSDYINANYVRGPKCLKKYYIACQAPMAATVNDFWRMMWEQNSRVILMLTEFMENGVEKCFEYIPLSEVSDTRRTFGDYQIIIKKRDIREKYVISQLQLKNLVTKTWREITHMWYFWPAKGVPEECHSIIAFLLEARSYLKLSQNAKEYDEDGHDSLITHNGSYANNGNVMENEDVNEVNIYNVQRGEKTSNGNSKTGTLSHSDGTKRGGPLVVHCSPGTGRTGTVIACDIGIRDFEMSRTVDVPKTVYRIRRDRANCVQTKDQYVFIYKILSEYATKLTGGVLDSI